MTTQETAGRGNGRPQGHGRVILGIDPGTALTGYGIVEKTGNRLAALSYGVVRTPAGLDLHERLALLFDELSALLARYQPTVAAVESLFFNVNVRTALAVGHARGVCLLACSQAGCGLYEYTPQQVKQAVVGYGKAEKQQVQRMVTTLLGLREVPRPDDAADALAVAICLANSMAMLNAAQRSREKGNA